MNTTNITSTFWNTVGNTIGSVILIIFCIFITFSLIFVGFLCLGIFYYQWGCDEYCRERNRNRNSYEIVNGI